MTSARRSNGARSSARSNGSRGAADPLALAARAAAACDLLGIARGSAAIVVACSGGADSAAALHVLRTVRPRARIFACYVDHRMRPAASIARDRAAVREQAALTAARAAFVRLERGSVAAGASREAALRTRRYEALASFARSVGARLVVTGHQRDDVAETTLMALARGAGLDGIAAMRPRRRIAGGVEIVRPLLWASKQALADYASAAGLPVSHDETNADARYRRNAVRALLAGLEAAARGATGAIARSAALAAEEHALLDAVTREAWDRCRAGRSGGLRASALRALPAALLRRVLRLEVRHAAGSARDFSYDHAVEIARAIQQRRGGVFHAGRALVTLSAGRLVAQPRSATPPAAAGAIEVAVPRASRTIAWGGGTIVLRRRSNARRAAGHATRTIALDADALKPGAVLTVRAPAPGDRFVPSGRRSPASLARFLAKERVAKPERAHVPVLCLGDAIVGVAGIRAAAPFAARHDGAPLEVTWRPPQQLAAGRPAADD